MSAVALISGALSCAPEIKTAKSGKAYCTASVRVAADSIVDYWRILAFSELAQAEPLRLGEGDKVSLQGSLKLEVYTNRSGEHKVSRTLFADHVMALRQPPPRQRTPKAPPTRAPDDGAPYNQNGRDFSDDIPF